MKTLLIGGNRFVGVEMAWKLLGAGHELSILSIDNPPAELRPHVRWVRANRDSVEELQSALNGQQFDCIVDNIAYVPAHVRPILEALKGRIGRYLMTGTTDVYPKQYPRMWREDEVEIRDYDLEGLSEHDRYNYGKRSCQALLQASDVPWTVIRPCSVTGARDNLSGAPRARGIHWFEQAGRSHFWASRLRDRGPILLFSNDENVFNLVWVSDVAAAVAHVLGRPETIGQAYNAVGDEIWTNERLVRALANASGLDPDIVHVQREVAAGAGVDYEPVYGTGPSWSLYDNHKLKKTGWTPTPAEQWLPTLFEMEPEAEYRSSYHTRLQEVALAHYVRRTHIAPRRAAPAPTITGARMPTAKPLDPPPAALLAGRCEPGASLDWMKRVLSRREVTSSKVHEFDGRILSSVGVGTWMGGTDDRTSASYVETIVHAAARGINVFDTAINYRHMVAERSVGAAIRRLCKLGYTREMFFVSSKGGYITHDGQAMDPAGYRVREYVTPGLITAEENERGHSLDPAFIDRQIDQSRSNLGLGTIDLYYLHNPEDDLPHLGKVEFYRRLQDVFVVLERRVAAGDIASYGLATWEGLRSPADYPAHLDLAHAMKLARSAAKTVGNATCGLRAVQLPFNVRDHAARTLKTQVVKARKVTALEAAKALQLSVFTSASVMQGAALPNELDAIAVGHSRHSVALAGVLQAPEVGTALVGMRSPQRVEEALLSIDLSDRILLPTGSTSPDRTEPAA